MDAAGVVANHSSQSAMGVGGGIGSKGEVVLFSSIAQIIENHPRLHLGALLFRIKLQNFGHVLGKIQHYGDVAALPCQAGAAPAAEYRSSLLAAGGDSCDYVVFIARDNNPNRELPVVRSIGGV